MSRNISRKSSSASNTSSESTFVSSILEASSLFKYSDELYCHCCTPTQSDVSYIGCDTCDDWFHFECIGIDPKSKISTYECKTCSVLNNREYKAVSYQIKSFGFENLSETEREELCAKYDKFMTQGWWII